MGHRSPRGRPSAKPQMDFGPELGEEIPAPPPRRERIAKFLASAGIASRRECEEYVRLGRVTIDGEIVTDLTIRVDPDRTEVKCDDVRVQPESKVYWWLNKPKGVLCTNKDSHGRRTVLDLLPLPRIGRRIYSVGRLDEESTGLLLLTNDGDMALRLTHPRYGVPKTYLALLAGILSNEDVERMLSGVWLSDGRVKAHQVKRMGTQGKATRAAIVLKEGRNREIRRMLAKLGHKVMSLHRVAIGPIRLKRLKLGEARPVEPEELYELRRLARLVKGPSRMMDMDQGEGGPAPRGSRPFSDRSNRGQGNPRNRTDRNERSDRSDRTERSPRTRVPSSTRPPRPPRPPGSQTMRTRGPQTVQSDGANEANGTGASTGARTTASNRPPRPPRPPRSPRPASNEGASAGGATVRKASVKRGPPGAGKMAGKPKGPADVRGTGKPPGRPSGKFAGKPKGQPGGKMGRRTKNK